MQKIIPIRDLKNTSLISEMCHEKDEPIFITKNGYEDMVIMSADTFSKYEQKKSSYQFEEYKVDFAAEPSSSYHVRKKYTLNEIRRILSPLFSEYNVKSSTLREINKNSDLEKEIKNTGILIYGE